MLKHGENGKGIRSRWYPETLYKRIRNIATVRDKISFIEGDGIAAMKKHARQRACAFFIDPPYTVAGKRAGSRLYTHFELDHEDLFRQCEKTKGDFLLTYDTADEVVAMAKSHGLNVDTVSMKNTHHSTMKELVIARDLAWVRD